MSNHPVYSHAIHHHASLLPPAQRRWDPPSCSFRRSFRRGRRWRRPSRWASWRCRCWPASKVLPSRRELSWEDCSRRLRRPAVGFGTSIGTYRDRRPGGVSQVGMGNNVSTPVVHNAQWRTDLDLGQPPTLTPAQTLTIMVTVALTRARIRTRTVNVAGRTWLGE